MNNEIKENDILANFIKDFGENNLTAIKRKPLLKKCRESIDFINNEFSHLFAKYTSYGRYIPNFITLVKSKSNI